MKEGDLVVLGQHRLMCGDSSNPMHFEKLMEGAAADLLFCDPPYGMGFESRGVLGDNKNRDEIVAFAKKWFPLALEHTKIPGNIYCFGTDIGLLDLWNGVFAPLEKEKKLFFRNLLTWDKENCPGMCSPEMKKFPVADEKLFFFTTAKPTISMMRTASDFFEENEPFRAYFAKELEKTGFTMKELVAMSTSAISHWKSKSEWGFPAEGTYIKLREALARHGIDFAPAYYDQRKAYYDQRKDSAAASRAFFDCSFSAFTNVLKIGRVQPSVRGRHGGHPNCKPYQLLELLLRVACPKGGIVLDPFAGSGTTLLVAEKLGMTCYAMEKSERWCDVIVNAYKNRNTVSFNQKKRVNRKGKQEFLQISMDI